MKKLTIVSIMLFLAGFSWQAEAQTPVCGGNFFDTGGAGANYADNENVTTTISPVNLGDVVTVTFTAFDVEATWDALYVYDGPDATFPQITSGNPPTNSSFPAGGYYGTAIPGPFTSTHSSGALTFVFLSDGLFNFAGWEANVTCAPPPACLAPTALTVANITKTSADLGWTENNTPAVNLWDIHVVAAGSPAPTGTTSPTDPGVTANPYPDTGLAVGAAYEFYVRADCGSGSTSTWAGPFAFITSPGCGGNFYDSGGPTANYSDSENSSITIYPDVPGDAVTLNFTAINLETCCDDLAIYNGVGTGGAVLSADLEAPASFSSTDPSGALTVTFTSDGSVNGLGWEASVTCAPLPTCLPPSDLAAANIAQTTADLSWTENNSPPATEWNIEYGPTGFTLGNGTIVNDTDGTPAENISGLSDGVTYDFYVTVVCSPTDQSTTAGPASFTTVAIPPVNDDLANAIALAFGASCTGDAYDNVGATAQTGETSGGCFIDATFGIPDNSVWFTFTAPANGQARITTDIPPAQLNDSEIAVYNAPTTPGDPATLGAALGCDQDGGEIVGFGFMSVLDLTGLTAGATYYIQVDGYSGAEGTFCIQVGGIPDYEYVFGWIPSDPSGVATATDNIVVVAGTATITAATLMNNLTVSSGSTLEIEAAISPSGDIENNGSMVFINDALKLGQLGDMTGSTLTGSGTTTVQRFIPARDDNKAAYRYIASAVNSTGNINSDWQEGAATIADNPNPGFGMFITGAVTEVNGFDATPAGAVSVFNFVFGTQSYMGIPNTDVDMLNTEIGYVAYVWGDRGVDIVATNGDPVATNTTLRATGSLAVGPQSTAGLLSTAGEFFLFGNPYQAIIDMDLVLAASSNFSTNFYYVWDPNLGTRGAYATVDLSAGTTNPSASEANQFLQPGQAAFVVATTPLPGPPGPPVPPTLTFLSFDESHKDVTQTPTDVFKPQNMASIELQLFQTSFFQNGGPLSDAVRVNFSQGESNAVLMNDAPKLGNFDENIALVNGTQFLSIENRALPTDGEVLQLYNDQYRVSDYTFKALVNGLADNVTAYLNDAYLGTQAKLANGQETIIAFSVDAGIPASIAPNRFSIGFEVNSLSVDEVLAKGFELYPNPAENGEFFIFAPGISGEMQIALYNLLGQKVLNMVGEMGSDGRIRVETHNLEAGVYMVKLSSEGKTFVDKLIIE